MTEEEVLEKYSTPGLRRNQLSRSAKKLNMEFDERLHGMTRAQRDEFLDRYWPEADASAVKDGVGDSRMSDQDFKHEEKSSQRRRYRLDGCKYCDELVAGGSFGPWHDASQNCQSGKRSHCTCDTCF